MTQADRDVIQDVAEMLRTASTIPEMQGRLVPAVWAKNMSIELFRIVDQERESVQAPAFNLNRIELEMHVRRLECIVEFLKGGAA